MTQNVLVLIAVITRPVKKTKIMISINGSTYFLPLEKLQKKSN